MKKIIILSISLVLLVTACGTSTPAAPANQPSATSAPDPTASPTAELNPTPTTDVLPTEAPIPTAVEAAATPSPTSQPEQDCIDKAAFYSDLTIPDGMVLKMGETFTKTWRIRNEGTCTWSEYELVYSGGDALNGAMSNPMPDVGPGEYGDISVVLKAPQRAGGLISYWQFKNTAGKTFGVGAEGTGQLWVQINVASPLPATATPSSGGVTMISSSSGSTPAAAPSPTSQTGQSSCVYTTNPDYEAQILASINNVRVQNGLGALALDSRLSAAALEHSLDMACNAIISHTGTDGSTWYDRVQKQGFANYNSSRENIYVGNPAFGGDANGAFNWWMNSEIHRKTLMNPDQKLIGISYIYSDNSEYGGNYTTVFARP